VLEAERIPKGNDMELGKYHNLVLDDDPSIAKQIERITDINAIPFQSLDSLLSGMGNLNPTAAFIDVHLGPSQSGLEAITVLRAKWPHMPVIVLTSDSSDEIIEAALGAGADDFLRKPIQPTELKARLNARLEEKANLVVRSIIRHGDITLSCAHQRLSANGRTVYLSPTALNLLCSLIEMKGTKVSRDILKRKVWGRLTLTDNALDRKVYEVRQALEEVESTVLIQNVYGQGYQITSQSEDRDRTVHADGFERSLPASNRPRKDQTIRVCLVEDQDADAVIVREALRKDDRIGNFELKRAKTLSEGIALSEKGGFDVALLDLTLPDSQGLDTFRKFSDHFPELPVVILSGITDDKLALEAVNNGAQDFLSKDEIRPVTLSKTIQYAFSRIRVSILEKSALREKQSQIEALSKLKSQFLANMSHEIRTPINAMIGMTSVLAQSDLTNDQSECVNTIRSSGEALLYIINEILDFSKFQSGKVALEETIFELRPIVEEVIDLFSAEANEKGIEFLETIDSRLPIRVVGDPTRLRQVLVNLIGNAMKFTLKGSVTVRVSLSELIGKGNKSSSQSQQIQSTIRFEIKDTGIGIKEAEKSRLFEVFNQANLSTTKQFGGTGLGLAISKTIIELMQGQIGFESSPQGTMFFFDVPLVTSDAQSLVPRPDLSHYTAIIFSEKDEQGTFLCRQLEARGLKTQVFLEENPLIERLKDTSANSGELTVVATSSEEKAEALCLKLEFMSINSPILWLVHKKSTSPIWKTRNVLRVPYTQSRLYKEITNLLCGYSPARERGPGIRKSQVSTIHLPFPILVAEDNPVNQRVMQRLLGRIGVRSDLVSNGAEALRSLENGKYAAILMDCSMPEMDGWAATEEIRRRGLSIPIIAMTANAFKEDRDRCLKSGMNEYLAKPITIEDLHAAISRLSTGKILETSASPGDPDTNSLQILNRHRLRSINAVGESEGDDQQFIKELKELFLEHAPATYEEVLQLIETDEKEHLKSKAHRLKGLAYNLAAEKLSAVCAQIEECASLSKMDEARNKKEILIEEWNNLINYLQRDLAA
jgi:DNA-binding response OmpR family regulator